MTTAKRRKQHTGVQQTSCRHAVQLGGGKRAQLQQMVHMKVPWASRASCTTLVMCRCARTVCEACAMCFVSHINMWGMRSWHWLRVVAYCCNCIQDMSSISYLLDCTRRV